MNIVMTGATSFSGMWFAKELIEKGHSLTLLLRRGVHEYSGIRQERLSHLAPHANVVEEAPFGSANFISALKERHWDLFCHHASHVDDYKSPNFDVLKAVECNTKNLGEVLKALNGTKLLLTGSVFEQGEGGDAAVSPYGLSKGLSFELFRFWCEKYNIPLGKFVIPNPFGPLEEGRFTSFLAKSWLEGATPVIQTPLYVRDNIPVRLLAMSYVQFAHDFFQGKTHKINPSFSKETVEELTLRFSRELSKRFSLPCPFEKREQTEFLEPKVRVNTDPIKKEQFSWNETQDFDLLAEDYERRFR